MRRLRHRDADMEGAIQRADDDHAAEHANLPSPVPATVHPQAHALLLRLMAENGLADLDLSKPLVEEGETLDAKIERYRADAEAKYQRAVADLAAIERQNVVTKIETAQAHLTSLEQRHARDGVVPSTELAMPTETPAAEATRRGRVRQPKVVLSDADPVTPEV